jgi:choline dehydrogenase-like flavoprotein
MRVAVIGSGLSGVSAAEALIARGLSVTVLDVGETLDARRSEAVARLRQMAPADWPPAEGALIRYNPTVGNERLPKKVHFGSDYVYAADRPFAPLATLTAGRAPFPTFAKGGFSTIWGAAALPVDGCDMADWPLSRAELEPYFRKVAGLLPICGGEGTLGRSFPAYRKTLGEVDPGPQGRALLQDLRRAEPKLLARETLYGKARLAMHTVDNEEGLACTGCGECFTGCVRGSIFSSEPRLTELVRRGRAVYRAGIFVERVGETEAGVEIEVIPVLGGERQVLSFDRVFLAGGPINTTRLLLRSRQLYDRLIFLKESQKFVLPVLRWRGAPSAIEHPSVTLASVFLETKTPTISDHWVHVQLMPMNAMVRDAAVPWAARGAARRATTPLFRRMMMAWCGLHSDHSSQLVLRLRRSPGEGPGLLELDLRVDAAARASARQAAWDLFAKGLTFRSLFVPWLIRFANPGSGTHCGASFPMRRQPRADCDSDIYGRPFGWKKIFVVDASVLPSIPGTTLAFSVMANAYRIASSAPL